MYWLPPSRVKQSGKATTTGGMRCSPINRSSRSGRFSRKPTQFVCDRPLLVNPTRSTSSGNPCPSCPAGRYTSTTRTDGSPSMLLLRAWLSTLSRLTEPIGPKNLRMHPPPAAARAKETFLPEHYGRPEEVLICSPRSGPKTQPTHKVRAFGLSSFSPKISSPNVHFRSSSVPRLHRGGATKDHGGARPPLIEPPAILPRPAFWAWVVRKVRKHKS